MNRNKDSIELNNADRVEDPDVGSRVPSGGDMLDADRDDLHWDEDPQRPLIVRAPEQSDAADIWRLVQACEELDLNSPYAYLLMCTDFADTALVVRSRLSGPRDDRDVRGGAAEEIDAGEGKEGDLVAFVLGYRPPSAMETLFVWQIGVAKAHRKRGLGARLLDVLVDRCRARFGIGFLEATVTPSNLPSRVLFTRFARDRSAQMHERVAFWSSSFPDQAGSEKPHEDEIRLRIGPIRRDVA